ncbi:putative glycosidase C21B10.07 [Cladobotryum mycophilum]|uniref:Glycosidase C21B10.07 n=1 Tax=Cladobotryum mycophilum TaxID=491253 RepID=A0ABR0SP75_9HYPO
MFREDAKPDDVPPRYEEVVLSRYGDNNANNTGPSGSRWNPRNWGKKIWAIVVAVAVIIIIIIVVVAVTSSRKKHYPDYSQVNYNLVETYEGEGFFDKFNYFTGYDPAGGFVHYVPEAQAKQLNLTYASQNSAILRVDTSVGPGSNPDASTGRFSVRIESKSTYNNGLFIFDVLHTPFGCGAWPALWLTDRFHWPEHGEIDIMEATNQASDGNQMTLHTTGGCAMDVKRKQTDKGLQDDCNHEKNGNAGCGVKAQDNTFGTQYNTAGGGIMAMEWRDAGIRMWQFARNAIPSDITSQKPDPTTWGTAAADFPSTDCNIGNHFRNNSIVLNIDLCGDLVYGVWGNSGCSSNCTDLVANHPEAFTNAYWEVGKFQVFQAS